MPALVLGRMEASPPSIDDIRRAQTQAAKGIHYVDVGTSGGVWGLERGYCMMIGGSDYAVQHIEPLLETIAPGFETAERTGAETSPMLGRAKAALTISAGSSLVVASK